MKFIKISTGIFLATGLSLGLASCVNDETASGVSDGNAVLTVNITKEMTYEPGTRTALEEVNGDLDCVWTVNDKVLVTDVTGAKKGVLTIIGDGGESTAQFYGMLTGVNDGIQTLNFLYLGKSVENPASVSNPYVFSVAAQEGTIESLSNNDILSSTATVNVADGIGYTEDMGLTRMVSFAHFEVKLPDGYRYDGQDITISGLNVKNTGSLSLSNDMTSTDGNIVVNKKDFYLTLLPEENMCLEFTTHIGTLDFKGTLTLRDFVAGEFVRKSHGKGIEVYMEPYIPEQTEEWIDLGLPSGNLWASCNLGAEKETDPGYYVGWGDADATMTSANPGDYPIFSPWYKNGYTTYEKIDFFGDGGGYTVHISNIQGKINYDTAYKLTNKEGCMPHASDFTELFQNSSIEYVTVNGTKCILFTSDINGNHILVPLAGVMKGSELVNDEVLFAIWTDSAIYVENAEYSDWQWWDYDYATVFTNETDLYDLIVPEAMGYLAYSQKSHRSNIRPIKKTK